MASHYRELKVWSMGIDLTLEAYRVTKTFPSSELYGLTNQIRRSASSIPANISEGKGRQTPKDFIHYLYMARGSLLELETHLYSALRLGYMDKPTHENLDGATTMLGRSLNALIEAIKKRVGS